MFKANIWKRLLELAVEWAMMLFGLVLAGPTAVYLQRRGATS